MSIAASIGYHLTSMLCMYDYFSYNSALIHISLYYPCSTPTIHQLNYLHMINTISRQNKFDPIQFSSLAYAPLSRSCLFLSCLVLSCLVLSCLVLSCLVLSCLVLFVLFLSVQFLSALFLYVHFLLVLVWSVLSCPIQGLRSHLSKMGCGTRREGRA